MTAKCVDTTTSRPASRTIYSSKLLTIRFIIYHIPRFHVLVKPHPCLFI